MRPVQWISRIGLLALLIPATAAVAQQESKPGVTEAETRYHAGASPLGEVEMHQDVNPKAPADLLRALRRLSRRAAQGCDRQTAHA
jgi:nitrite reductase (NO-forming)/hydroxylamine reductase